MNLVLKSAVRATWYAKEGKSQGNLTLVDAFTGGKVVAYDQLDHIRPILEAMEKSPVGVVHIDADIFITPRTFRKDGQETVFMNTSVGVIRSVKPAQTISFS